MDVLSVVARIAVYLGLYAAFAIGYATGGVSFGIGGLTDHGARVMAGMASMLAYWTGVMVLSRLTGWPDGASPKGHGNAPPVGPDRSCEADPGDSGHSGDCIGGGDSGDSGGCGTA